MRGVIRNIFDDHLPTVLAEREGHDLSEREWRGVWCIATCRTAAQGTHIVKSQPWLHTSRAYGLYHPAAATMLTQARSQIQDVKTDLRYCPKCRKTGVRMARGPVVD
jgi:hypothetical protein